jgi:hypothetical protein
MPLAGYLFAIATSIGVRLCSPKSFKGLPAVGAAANRQLMRNQTFV